LGQGGKSKLTQSGMDFVDSLDRILVSGPEASAGGGAGQRGIVALQGRFDRAKLKKSMPAGTAIERTNGIDLFVPPATTGDPMVAGWVNETLMLVGDRESVTEVLDARSGIEDASLLARARKMESEHEFWLIADAPPSFGNNTAPGAAQGLDDIRGMELGISLRQGLSMRANLTMVSAEKAQSAAMLAQMFSAVPDSQGAQPAMLSSLAKNLRVKVDGAVVHVDLQMPMAQLERAATGLRASLEDMSKRTLESMIGVGGGGMVPGVRPAYRAQTGAGAPAPAPAPSASVRPSTKTIRIVGLEEGDKVINYTSPGNR